MPRAQSLKMPAAIREKSNFTARQTSGVGVSHPIPRGAMASISRTQTKKLNLACIQCGSEAPIIDQAPRNEPLISNGLT